LNKDIQHCNKELKEAKVEKDIVL